MPYPLFAEILISNILSFVLDDGRPQQLPAEEKPLIIQTQRTECDVIVEVANTRRSRSKGLTYRNSLKRNCGMLFVFGQPAIVKMWTRNCTIALDIIFIRDDHTIAYIAQEVPPSSRNRVSSREKVRYALEVNAGFSAEHSIEIGQKVLMPDSCVP